MIIRKKKTPCAYSKCSNTFYAKHKGQKTCINDVCPMGYLAETNSPESIEERYKIAQTNVRDHSWYESKLEDEINAIVRLIDFDTSCISCSGWGKPEAGHYHGVGKNNSLRFNLHNIHRQEFNCNVGQSANITGYNVGLIERYGKEYQEYVEYTLVRTYPQVKLSKNDLDTAIKNARDVKKELQNSHEKTPYTPDKRVLLRDFYNSVIGIYKLQFK